MTEAFYQEIGADGFAENEQVQALTAQVASTLRDSLLINTKVTLLPPGEAPRSQGGKIQRVEDRRNL